MNIFFYCTGLRLLGVGRNQYIDLMNSARSRKGIFPLPGIFGNRRGRELLPERPVDTMTILPWWTVQVGYVTEEDINKGGVDKDEHCLIDQVIDGGPCPAGTLNKTTVRQLYL